MMLVSNLKGSIEIEVVYCDQHLVEYQFRCSNGGFSGVASIYLNHNDLSSMADGLSGFPANQTDNREFELGTFDSNHAAGGIRLHFYCLDSAGHSEVAVKLRGKKCKALGEVESVALRIPIRS